MPQVFGTKFFEVFARVGLGACDAERLSGATNGMETFFREWAIGLVGKFGVGREVLNVGL